MVLRDAPKPQITSKEILVRVKSVGICGNDLTIYKGHFSAERSKPPLIIGHEFSGVVEEASDDAKRFKEGTRVAIDPLISCGVCHCCRSGIAHVCKNLKLLGIDVDGAYAEYVKVSEERVHPISDSLSFDEGALVEPVAVAVHCVGRASLAIGETVLVIGGGPIGMLIALTSLQAGAKQVVLTEIQQYRSSLARKLGLNCLNPNDGSFAEAINQFFEGKGPDIAFEVTGTENGFQQAVDLVSVRGRVIEVGVPKGKMSLDLRKGNFGELSIIGSRVYTPADIDMAIELLTRGTMKAKELIQKFDLEKAEDAIKQLISGKSNIMKSILIVN